MTTTWVKLARHAKALPGATEDIKWGADLCYSIGGKMFAVFGMLDARPHGVGFKTDPDAFEALTSMPGVQPSKYLARAQWVSVDDDSALSLVELERLVTRSHALVLARLLKKLQRELG
jgi:predicted DNA-binding protein (MmcQ/YjbR family)